MSVLGAHFLARRYFYYNDFSWNLSLLGNPVGYQMLTGTPQEVPAKKEKSHQTKYERDNEQVYMGNVHFRVLLMRRQTAGAQLKGEPWGRQPFSGKFSRKKTFANR